MASNKNLQRLSSQQSFKGELNLSSISDEQIKKQISVTHAHSDKKFDVSSLFAVVKNILVPATNIFDTVFLVPKQVYRETHVEIAYEASWIPKLCTLKQLYCEMACKAPGVEIAHKTASILNKLKDYSLDAMVVLALAAFAMEYGEFCHLAHYHSSDQLTKSLGFLRHVPVVLMPPGIEKHGKLIDELNSLIRTTLEVFECILKLEELCANHDTNDVPALSNDISVDVYLTIISTVVACSTQMCFLIDNENKKQELSTFVRKINITLHSIQAQIELCDQQIAQIEAYRKLKRFLQNPTDIVEVLNALIFAGDIANKMKQYNSNIESLKTKHVLLLFTGLDISDEDIFILKPIYEKISKEDQYLIIWIPIVEQWTEEIQKKFKVLESKMPSCYTVPRFSSVSSIKYIKEQWHFENRPIIVVLNPHGMVEHQNAFRMITVWGTKAFPLTIGNEKKLSTGKNWFISFMYGISQEVSTWIKQEKYILFYGGEDNWTQQFTKTAEDVDKDELGEKKISIQIFCVSKDSESKDDCGIQGRFWNRIENFFFSMFQEDTELDEMTQVIQKEILKLLSYKTQKGWAVLCKGSTFVFSGYGTTVMTFMEKFSEWKEYLPKNEFESSIKEYYGKLLEKDHPCCCFDIPANNGKIPESMKCPHCSSEMKKNIRFECCPGKEPGKTKAQH